jgi:L-rhamnose mutarotase
VLKAIKRSNIRNYSIAVQQIERKFYLFSYYEYIGDNYDVDMKRIAMDVETQRWWQETAPCQLPLPDAAPEGI